MNDLANIWDQYVEANSRGLTPIQKILLSQLLETASIIQACNEETSWDAAVGAASVLISQSQAPF